MKAYLVFDIETLPNESKEKILEMQSILDEEEFSKETLKAINNKIVAISYVLIIEGQKPMTDLLFSIDNEKEIVTDFYNVMSNVSAEYELVLVGYNINKFDIPQLRVKCAKYISEDRQELFEIKPWESYDLFEKVGYTDKLSDWLAFFELPSKYKNKSGKDFITMYLNDEIEDMRKYSMQDAIVEAKLFKKLYKI